MGGGPAGAACAIACAQPGLTVGLAERDAEPRDKPGEALHPGVEPLLSQLGVSSAELEGVTGARFPGVWSAWGGPPVFQPFGEDEAGPWLGYQVRRSAFEALLLDRAVQAGVQRRQGAAEAVLHDGERVIGARVDGKDIPARITIDATGPARWLTRRLDLASRERSPRLLARYGYVRGDIPERRDAPLIAADAEGWTWIARIDGDLHQWVRLDFDGRTRARDWRPEALAGLNEARPTRGAEVAWRRAERTAGPGWMLIGDAAASLDPASSHGVLKALMSGVAAAGSIAAVLKQGAPEAQAGRAYHQWLAGWFDTDVARLGQAYRDVGAEGFG